MDSLLAKAEIVNNQIRSRSSKSTQAEFLDGKEVEVMAEMNAILEKSRSSISDSTMTFSARSSGIAFPLFINLGALTVLVVLGVFFYIRLNQVEVSLVSRAAQSGSAEGLIIEALREASEEELSRKESQILSIQSMLEEAERSRASLIVEFDNERSSMQDRLKDELSQELETERQRLIAEGFGAATVAIRLAAFEEQKQSEYQSKLMAMNADYDRQLQERSAQFNKQMDDYRRTLALAKDEQEAIKRSLEQQLAKASQESQTALATMSADRAAAMEKLESLGRQQENAKLIEDRILSMYDSVNSSLKQNAYQAALSELDRLERFLGSAEALRISSVAERRNTEQFLVDSLRRLISNEIALEASKVPNQAAFAAQALLDSVTSRVEKGNRLYAEGRFEDAKTEYIAALTQIPQLDAGYSKLQELTRQQVSRERALLERQLAETATLYQNNQYHASIERYRQTLGLLEEGTTRTAVMLNTILDAGYRLRRASEPPPAPVVIREELTPQEKELLRKAQAAENQRRVLMESLDTLRSRYALTDEDSDSPSSQESLVTLLNAKLLIRRALSDKTIRETYPELYTTLDSVFEIYGEEQRTEGRSQALQEIIRLTDYLVSPPQVRRLPTLSNSTDARQRELLLEFLGKLRTLFGSQGQS